MSSQFLRTDTSPSRLGHIVLTGVFCAVALVFGAKWFVAADYQSLSPGDRVTTVFGLHGGEVQRIDGDVVTIKTTHGRAYESPINEVTEQ